MREMWDGHLGRALANLTNAEIKWDDGLIRKFNGEVRKLTMKKFASMMELTVK